MFDVRLFFCVSVANEAVSDFRRVLLPAFSAQRGGNCI